MSYLEDHYNEIFKKYSTEELLEDEKGYMRIDGRGRYNFYYQRHMTDAQAKVCLDKNLRIYGD